MLQRLASAAGQVARLPARPLGVEREGLAHRPGEPEGAEVERVVAGLAARDGDQELLGMARERHGVALDVAPLLELRPVRAVPALDRRARGRAAGAGGRWLGGGGGAGGVGGGGRGGGGPRRARGREGRGGGGHAPRSPPRQAAVPRSLPSRRPEKQQPNLYNPYINK